MFISYEYKKYIGYDDKTTLYSWEYEITDSEFGTVEVVITPPATVLAPPSLMGMVVINEYEERNLPVAANLMKAILFSHKYYNWPIADIIYWNKQGNPKFSKYEKELEKYFSLL